VAIVIVTCMDNRIRTEGAMGLDPEEAHLLRTAGGRVTDDVLRSLTVACSLLGVRRVALVHHTDCRALSVEDGPMRQRLTAELGRDPGPMQFLGDRDLEGSVHDDLAALRRCPTLPEGVTFEGYIYDTDAHRLTPVAPRPVGAEVPGGGGRSPGTSP
jgi:carbonic anhydrase